MNRIEIEVKLNRDRAWFLENLAQMSEDDLYRPRTLSDHDPSKTWSFADHFIHTAYVEGIVNDICRRHLAGESGMGPLIEMIKGAQTREAEGVQTREEGRAGVNKLLEEWADKHRGKPLDEMVRITLEVRAETLKILASASDDELESKIPGAPWADGTVGGIIANYGDHAQRHFNWAKEGTAGAPD